MMRDKLLFCMFQLAIVLMDLPHRRNQHSTGFVFHDPKMVNMHKLGFADLPVECHNYIWYSHHWHNHLWYNRLTIVTEKKYIYEFFYLVMFFVLFCRYFNTLVKKHTEELWSKYVHFMGKRCIKLSEFVYFDRNINLVKLYTKLEQTKELTLHFSIGLKIRYEKSKFYLTTKV